MAYTLDVNLALGAANTGLTLEMQLKDTAGSNVGSAVTTGFVEFGSTGNYLFHYTAWPDGHRGAAVFQVSPGGAVKAAVAINPQETENPDVKTSTRSSHTAADVWASGTRTLTSFGTLVADTATAVWASGTRTLTSFGTLVADIWNNGTRTLTSFGTLAADTATAVWAAGTRTLTSFGTLAADTATAVWAAGTRTLTSFGTLAADAATAVWAAGTRTLTSFGTLVADIWSNATRTLTTAIAAVTPPPVVTGDTVTITRGDTMVLAFTGLGSLTGRSKLWFTVKESGDDADTEAVIQIEETGGLLRLNGAATTTSNGTTTIISAGTGDVTFTLKPAASAALELRTGLVYDVQVLIGGVVTTLTQGEFGVTSDVTRAVS